MDELDNASDRIQSLMIDMVKVMEKYKNDNEKIVSNIQRELDKSLSQKDGWYGQGGFVGKSFGAGTRVHRRYE